MFVRLQNQLLPQRVIMTVSNVNDDGTVTVNTGGGASIRAIGTNAVGTKVYVQDRLVLGVAPDLTHFEIEV